MYFKPKNEQQNNDVKIKKQEDNDMNKITSQIINKETVNQIKNAAQEKK